jgi:nitrate/nitrite transport system permease protein
VAFAPLGAGLQERLRAGLLSALLLALILGVWHLVTTGGPAPVAAPAANLTPEQIEYLKLMGKDPTAAAGGAAPAAKSGFPTLGQLGAVIAKHASAPFYDNGPNDKGLGLQLAHSLGRVALGFGLAVLVAVPLGFVIGMSPLLYRALDPFIQVLKPISPLAWMPLALYTIKDSSISGVFVIFICSMWPMLISTAFGVAGVRREWLNVARTLEVRPLRRAFEVILPAAAPTILTGMRISMGIAWLVIVAAEMLVGGTGIGYFVWNEWNNLSLPNVIVAILVIGVVGMLLDLVFARLQKAVTYAD